MQVAVTGVSGFIGSYIARQLKSDGHQVIGLVRPTSPREHVAEVVDHFVVGDHADPKAWDELLDGADALVHNSVERMEVAQEELADYVQSNLVGSVGLLAAAGERPTVFVSSVAAVADILPQYRGVVTPEHPTRPASYYGAYKAAVEQFCWAEHLGKGRHLSIVRPSAVYGIARSLDRCHGYRMIRVLREHGRFDRPGGGKFVHVEDVAAVIVRALTQPQASGQVYNLADCYARWGDWASIAAEVMGLVNAQIDLSSPDKPKNQFSKENVQALGVALDRGHEGIRTYLQELVELAQR